MSFCRPWTSAAALLRPCCPPRAFSEDCIIPRVRWSLSAVRGHASGGARSFRSIASGPQHSHTTQFSAGLAAWKFQAADSQMTAALQQGSPAAAGSNEVNRSEAPRAYKRVAALPPLLAPESTANDWFRFLAKPSEYWDHRQAC